MPWPQNSDEFFDKDLRVYSSPAPPDYRARAALAQPEPVAPTDEQTFELADDLGIIRGHGGDLHVSLLDLTPFAESVLTRYARPTIHPVPVSERPWERDQVMMSSFIHGGFVAPKTHRQ
jgi:hypothetical protein